MNLRSCLLILGLASIASKDSEFDENASTYRNYVNYIHNKNEDNKFSATVMAGTVLPKAYTSTNYKNESSFEPIKIGSAESLWDVIHNRGGNYSNEQAQLKSEIRNARLPDPQLAAHLISHHCINPSDTSKLWSTLTYRAQNKKKKTTLLSVELLPGGTERNTPVRIVSEVVTALKNLENPLEHIDDSTSKDQLVLNVPVTFYSESSTQQQGSKSMVMFRVRIDRNKATGQLQPIQIYPVYSSVAAAQNSRYPLFVYQGDGSPTAMTDPKSWQDSRVFRAK